MAKRSKLRRLARAVVGLSGAAVGLFLAGAGLRSTEPPTWDGKEQSILDFTMKRLDGEDQPLKEFEGKVVLIVNTASECGLTPQYRGLEALYEDKKDAGLVVLGFPANNFGGQEPGTDQEISAFCTDKYGVTFPMFSKVSVKGEDQCDLYKFLVTRPEPIGGEIPWNFTKFIANRQGVVVARFGPRVKPDDAEFVARIEALLAEPAPESKDSASSTTQGG